MSDSDDLAFHLGTAIEVIRGLLRFEGGDSSMRDWMRTRAQQFLDSCDTFAKRRIDRS
jgi:hypothetical protein